MWALFEELTRRHLGNNNGNLKGLTISTNPRQNKYGSKGERIQFRNATIHKNEKKREQVGTK